MKNRIYVVLTILSVLISSYTNAQDKEKELIFLAGTIQPFLLQGGNFEVDFYTSKMVFNYSHGFSLNMNSGNGTAIGDLSEQELALYLPYSTGFGIGYRLNKYFDVRIESKAHKFNVYYDGTDRTSSLNQIVSYKTYTIGLGAYFRWKPFEKKENLLKGVFTSTSLRYWPKVKTTLEDDKISYFNRNTLKEETHEAANIGMANSPFIVNFALGYSILF